MAWSEDANWAFPDGQVWIKHFDLEMERGNATTKKPIETRFLIKTAAGAYGLSYRWRADGSDADLVGYQASKKTSPSIPAAAILPRHGNIPHGQIA